MSMLTPPTLARRSEGDGHPPKCLIVLLKPTVLDGHDTKPPRVMRDLAANFRNARTRSDGPSIVRYLRESTALRVTSL